MKGLQKPEGALGLFVWHWPFIINPCALNSLPVYSEGRAAFLGWPGTPAGEPGVLGDSTTAKRWRGGSREKSWSPRPRPSLWTVVFLWELVSDQDSVPCPRQSLRLEVPPVFHSTCVICPVLFSSLPTFSSGMSRLGLGHCQSLQAGLSALPFTCSSVSCPLCQGAHLWHKFCYNVILPAQKPSVSPHCF